jgi:hypothetical protein
MFNLTRFVNVVSCSHLGGFFLFLGLAVANEMEWAAGAPAPAFMTMVMTSANASSWAANNTTSVRKWKLLF